MTPNRVPPEANLASGAIIHDLVMFGPLKPRAEARSYMLSPLRGEENAASPSYAWQLYNLKAFASG
jgi:hypothetical protein